MRSDEELSVSINYYESSNPSTSVSDNASNETPFVTMESQLSTSLLFESSFNRIVREKGSQKKLSLSV